jgi:hypothetical protein
MFQAKRHYKDGWKFVKRRTVRIEIGAKQVQRLRPLLFTRVNFYFSSSPDFFLMIRVRTGIS